MNSRNPAADSLFGFGRKRFLGEQTTMGAALLQGKAIWVVLVTASILPLIHWMPAPLMEFDNGRDCRRYLEVLRQHMVPPFSDLLPGNTSCEQADIQQAYIHMSTMGHAAGVAALFQLCTSVLVEVTHIPLASAQLYSAIGTLFYAVHPARISLVASAYDISLAAATLLSIVTVHLFYRLIYQARQTAITSTLLAFAFYISLFVAMDFDGDVAALPLLLLAFYFAVPAEGTSFADVCTLYTPVLVVGAYMHRHRLWPLQVPWNALTSVVMNFHIWGRENFASIFAQVGWGLTGGLEGTGSMSADGADNGNFMRGSGLVLSAACIVIKLMLFLVSTEAYSISSFIQSHFSVGEIVARPSYASDSATDKRAPVRALVVLVCIAVVFWDSSRILHPVTHSLVAVGDCLLNVLTLARLFSGVTLWGNPDVTGGRASAATPTTTSFSAQGVLRVAGLFCLVLASVLCGRDTWAASESAVRSAYASAIYRPSTIPLGVEAVNKMAHDHTKAALPSISTDRSPTEFEALKAACAEHVGASSEAGNDGHSALPTDPAYLQCIQQALRQSAEDMKAKGSPGQTKGQRCMQLHPKNPSEYHKCVVEGTEEAPKWLESDHFKEMDEMRKRAEALPKKERPETAPTMQVRGDGVGTAEKVPKSRSRVRDVGVTKSKKKKGMKKSKGSTKAPGEGVKVVEL